jgi:hypothetical protein
MKIRDGNTIHITTSTVCVSSICQTRRDHEMHASVCTLTLFIRLVGISPGRPMGVICFCIFISFPPRVWSASVTIKMRTAVLCNRLAALTVTTALLLRCASAVTLHGRVHVQQCHGALTDKARPLYRPTVCTTLNLRRDLTRLDSFHRQTVIYGVLKDGVMNVRSMIRSLIVGEFNRTVTG